MSQVSSDYVSVVYSEDRTPKTDYPSKLVSHLITRFGLEPGARLVEPGCGRGEFLAAFQEAKFDCVGLDREPSAQQLQPDLDVRVCDVSSETFPFEDASVDVVYHKSMIEHVADPRHLMEETYRILRPGGKLIVLTPDWHTQMKNFFEDFTHCRPYDVAVMVVLVDLPPPLGNAVHYFQLAIQERRTDFAGHVGRPDVDPRIFVHFTTEELLSISALVADDLCSMDQLWIIDA